MKKETAAARASHHIDPESGAILAPIQPSTTFERAPDGEYPGGYVYSRTGNPNRQQLEDILTTLEGGAACAAFSSGSAASAAVFQALSSGDHVVAPNDCYHGTRAILRDVFERWGLQVTFTDVTDPEQVRGAIRPDTRLVWVETPSNPMLKVTDIRRTAEIAHGAGCGVRVRQYLGDADAPAAYRTGRGRGGAFDDEVPVGAQRCDGRGGDRGAGGRVLSGRCGRCRRTYGAVPSAFDCWLTLRGIRTLHLRMRAHCENARAVASFLSEHPRVAAVHYPGLAAPVEREVAAAQMSDFGGMLSFQVEGGRERAMEVAAGLRLFTRATSLGGTESLIEHRASVEGPDTQTPDNLLRVSVGIESVDDLLEDLGQALGV